MIILNFFSNPEQIYHWSIFYTNLSSIYFCTCNYNSHKKILFSFFFLFYSSFLKYIQKCMYCNDYSCIRLSTAMLCPSSVLVYAFIYCLEFLFCRMLRMLSSMLLMYTNVHNRNRKKEFEQVLAFFLSTLIFFLLSFSSCSFFARVIHGMQLCMRVLLYECIRPLGYDL